MRIPRQILVPTDFSEPAERAKAYALVLAEAFRAQLHLLHVIPDPLDMGWGVDAAHLPQLLERTERRVRAQFDEALTEEERGTLDARFAVETGSAPLWIVEYANKQGIDLIVMGTHGRGALEKMWLGSVTERVLQRARCPVVVLRELEIT